MLQRDNSDIYYSKDKNGFNRIAKSSFSMEYINVPYVVRNPYYHYHDSYELYYLLSGERYYFIKDKTYHVKSGNFVLINSYDIHCTTYVEGFGYERILIIFKKDFLDGFLDVVDDVNLFECFDKNTPIIKLNFKEQYFAETLLKMMMKEYNTKDKGYSSYLKTALIQLLTFLSRQNVELTDCNNDYNNSSHKIISEITGYINNNYNNDITLNSISERFFISPYYLSRVFKKIMGFSFVEYLNGVRIKEAQNLLLKTDMSIVDISQTVGYKSLTHFGRVFKNVTGSSPRHYKKIMENGIKL